MSGTEPGTDVSGRAVAPPAGSPLLSVEASRFRQVLGHYCSGVTVITSLDEEGPVGFACQTFHSLSLDPPLISFNVAKRSSTWPKIRWAGRFCVNVLAADQEHLCRRFAVSGGHKFRNVSWTPSTGGSPILAGVLAWIDCEVEAEYEGGDHVIVVGRVHDLAADGGAEPLLFYRGAFSRLWDWPVFE